MILFVYLKSTHDVVCFDSGRQHSKHRQLDKILNRFAKNKINLDLAIL